MIKQKPGDQNPGFFVLLKDGNEILTKTIKQSIKWFCRQTYDTWAYPQADNSRNSSWIAAIILPARETKVCCRWSIRSGIDVNDKCRNAIYSIQKTRLVHNKPGFFMTKNFQNQKTETNDNNSTHRKTVWVSCQILNCGLTQTEHSNKQAIWLQQCEGHTKTERANAQRLWRKPIRINW